MIALLIALLTFAPGRNLVQVDVPDNLQVKPGQTFEVPVKFFVQDGYHINSNKPSEEYMLPTHIEWEKSSVKHLDEVYPPPAHIAFGFTAGKKLSVYEGNAIVKARFTAPSATGKITLDGKFLYQACDQRACYPPSSVALHVPVRVER